MTEKYDLAQYCANLLSLMSSREDAGISRGPTLAREYERAYKRLRELIDKEEEDARTSEREQRRNDEDGASGPEGLATGRR